MKPLKTLMVICCVTFILWSCEDDENPSGERRFDVANYNAIEIGGDAVIKIEEGSPSDNRSIIVKGRPQLISAFDIRVMDQVLHIEASEEVDLADSIIVIAPARDLTRIVLEADQKAVVVWQEEDTSIVLDHLDIKTEANSMLGLLGLKIRSINIQQEAQSKVLLTSLAPASGQYKVEKEKVEFLNDSTVLAGETLWHVDSLSVVNENGVDYYLFTGEKTRSFFVTNKINAVLQATSELLADELPVNKFDIKLEGKSTGRIWVLNALTGKGEGESILYYNGAPTVNFVTQGSARIVNGLD